VDPAGDISAWPVGKSRSAVGSGAVRVDYMWKTTTV
jgi:hypothetical protein